MKILTTPAVIALSLVVLSACASDEDYDRKMEAFYRAECAKRGQGGAAYEACRKALIEERFKRWQQKIEQRKRKRKVPSY